MKGILLCLPVIFSPVFSFQISCASSLPAVGMCSFACSWPAAMDRESGVKHLVVSVGTTQGSQDYKAGVQLGPTVTSFVVYNVMCRGAEKYYVTVRAVNNVLLQAVAFSNVTAVDTTPPRNGTVSILSSRRGVRLTSSGSILTGQYSPCWVDSNTLTVTWTEFEDVESPVTR